MFQLSVKLRAGVGWIIADPKHGNKLARPRSSMGCQYGQKVALTKTSISWVGSGCKVLGLQLANQLAVAPNPWECSLGHYHGL